MTFRLQLLGPPSVTDAAGATPPALGWGKPLALLCLLAVRGEARRDEVVDLLWRGIQEARARNAFRQALHRLRTALGESMIPQDRERLRLIRSDRLTIDLDEFETAVSAGRLDHALSLYGGDFLENTQLGEPPYDMWVEHERTRLRARFRDVLEGIVAQAASSGRWMDAISGARRLLAITPFDPSAAQLAATTLVSAGRRLEAQELLRQFGARLESELGLPMPAELRSALTRLERQSDVGRTSSAPAAAAGASFVLPLRGREAELSQLLALWRSTSDDSGALALIEAETGLGKTRLTRELALHARSLGALTGLTGRERAAGAQLPFGIFAEALRPLVHAPGIAGASRHLLAEAARLLPDLRDALDLPDVRDVEDDAARLRFFEGVAALIDSAAYEQPVLLVLEDLHFIAPSSLELLQYLCVRLAGSAVMFVLTVRPSSATPPTLLRLRALARPSDAGAPAHAERAQIHTLAPLSTGDAFDAAIEIGRRAGLSDSVVERVAQRANGNPAGLSELLRRAAAGDEIAALPVSMRELVADRLHRLSSSQRRLFLVLALLDRPITVGLAAGAAHLSESAVSEAAQVLAQEGLVELAGDGEIAASDLAAEIALEAAGSPSRAFMSGWIAEALASLPTTKPAELARFFAAAGQSAQAYEHARRAAYDALAVGASAEAVQFLNSARTFATTADQQREIESLLTSVGSGRPRLVAGTQPEVGAEVLASGQTAQTPIPPGFQRLFPNWRLLLGAAVATLVISAVVLAPRSGGLQPMPRALSTDTLMVADGETGRGFRYVTGDLSSFAISERVEPPRSEPPWLDSLARPWVAGIADARGRSVALAKVTPRGSDVYVISADRRDTTALVLERGDARPLGWSPDGRWLLVGTTRTLPNGNFDADLFAFRIVGSRIMVPLDTAARRAITEASWSPDGSRIAWVARVGTERQLEVFASLSDGSGVQNVSRHPADDYHIAWSHDGELLAFTSTRDGNAELYAASFRENRLWRLTRDPSHDDRGAFSMNGRFIAFESTRGGAAGVYVMPALGGDARRVGGSLPLSVAKWLGGGNRYVDRVRVSTPVEFHRGDSAEVRLLAFDQFHDPIPVRRARFELLDSAIARLLPPTDSAEESRTFVARRPGLARIVGSVGRWRTDTAFIRIGYEPVVLLESGSGNPLDVWRALGTPAPTVVRADGGRTAAVALNADREWESGVLSRAAVPLIPGLTFTAELDAPLGVTHDAVTSVSVAFVAPEEPAEIDATAPQFLRHASFSWNADAGRFVYAVGREVFSEAAASLGVGARLSIQLRVESDSTVTFTLGGSPRWRSTLRVIEARRDPRVHLWIAGRATGESVRLSSARVSLTPSGSREAAPDQQPRTGTANPRIP